MKTVNTESGAKLPVLCSVVNGGALPIKTISDIARQGMKVAGVPLQFKAQSIRGAAASAAKDYGATIEEV